MKYVDEVTVGMPGEIKDVLSIDLHENDKIGLNKESMTMTLSNNS